MSNWIVTTVDKDGNYHSYFSVFSHKLPSFEELQDFFGDKFKKTEEVIIFMQRLRN